MKYEKAKAEIVVFDSSDVLTDKSNSCGHQTSGNSCKNNNVQQFVNCPSMNHSKCGEKGDFDSAIWSADWLGGL